MARNEQDSTTTLGEGGPRDARDVTVDQERIVEKVAKILRLAARSDVPGEAAAATERAQAMLAQYNLDLATVERRAAGSGSTSERGKREDAATVGGQYQYQRDLWRAVARLNFCLYFATEEKAVRSQRRRGWDGTLIDYPRYYYRKQHRLVGRVVNTTATRVMAAYIEQEIERLCRLRYPQQSQFFSRAAVSYREGMADNVVVRLQKQRQDAIREEAARKEREVAEMKARGIVTENALSLEVLVDAETDANNDFLYGEGWSAEVAAERKRRAAEWAEEERQQAEWDAAHPEEAAARRKKEQAEARRHYSRARGPGSRGGSMGKPRDESAYYQGYEKGKSISLNRQADDRSAATPRLASGG